jgi:hypothetical protein
MEQQEIILMKAFPHEERPRQASEHHDGASERRECREPLRMSVFF